MTPAGIPPAEPAARPRRAARRLIVPLLAALAIASASYLGLRRLERRVSEASAPERVRASRVRELSFAPRPRPTLPAALLAGDGTVEAIVRDGGDRWLAGGSGLQRLDGSGRPAVSLDDNDGLPSLRVSAAVRWAGSLTFSLERGTLGRLGAAGTLEEATTEWGTLTVRSLAVGEGGELFVGAREGLFRADPGGTELERLSTAPVRSLALLPGGRVAAGGEEGLTLVTLAGESRPLPTPDPWIEDLSFDGQRLWAVTARGVALAPLDALEPPGGGPSPLAPHPRGADVTRGAAFAGAFWGLPVDGPPRLAVLAPGGERREPPTPERFRKLLPLDGELYADGPSGLFRYDDPTGFSLVRPRPPQALPRPFVAALAVSAREVWTGLFDGALARSNGPEGPWESVEGSDAWGVNALLPSAGSIWAATLRGAYRVDLAVAPRRNTGLARSRRLVPVGPEPRSGPAGPGGAFSLAATSQGIAIGYARGVYLPARRLLSAFHGLPGNQACALATGPAEALWVGTPTGLGRIQRQRVSSRTVPGEGRLPHPWVTALLALAEGRLLVGTYGGGLALRAGEADGEAWTTFPETAGVKVNAGALARLPDGSILAGTQGKGLLVSDGSLTRFERLAAALPSPDVFSLALYPEESPDSVLVGTNEGLARLMIDRILSMEPR